MAVLTSAGFYGDIGYTLPFRTGGDFSSNLPDVGHAVVDRTTLAPYELLAEDLIQPGALTDNKPIEALERVMTSAGLEPSFYQDFYNRVHITPSAIDLGNLLSGQEREIEVWSAYATDQDLPSIDESGTQGITFEATDDPPTTFAPYEARVYTLTISTNGPPVIGATYTFNFTDDTPVLTITGRRAVIWPFEPDAAHTEQLVWKTDIIDAYEVEQRIALRTAPRQRFIYTFELDPRQFSRAKAMSTQWSYRVYGIPVWSEVQRVGALSLGVTSISLDTANRDFRANGLVAIWDDDENFLAAEITAVGPTSVTLKIPTTAAFTNALVAPMRFARTYQGTPFERSHNERVMAQVTFDVTDNVDLGDEGDYDTYLGAPVLTDRTVVAEEIGERIVRSQDVFDNGQGAVVVDTTHDWARHRQFIGLSSRRSIERRWMLRRWLHARRGRQKAFWLPSWNADLEVLDDIAAASTSIRVRNIAYYLYYETRDIMLQTKAGARYYRRVTGGSDQGDGSESLTLASSFGVDVLVADIDFVCFISHVRLDSDTVTLRHGSGGRVDISVPVTETPTG